MANLGKMLLEQVKSRATKPAKPAKQQSKKRETNRLKTKQRNDSAEL